MSRVLRTDGLHEATITGFNAVTDEYTLRVPGSGQVTTWAHAERTAFVATARLPDAQQATGVMPVSVSDEDVEVKVEVEMVKAPGGVLTSLVTVPRADVEIQEWFMPRVTQRQLRLSHNCSVM